jgi:sn-glycerol 3-phosphate transport system permease protein
MPTDDATLDRGPTTASAPGGDELVEPASPLDQLPTARVTTAATIGRSRARRNLGLAAQYAVLVALAAVVLVPVIYIGFLALTSNPIVSVRDTRLWHPVDVAWKDRTWFTGGTFSVVLRSLVLLAVMLWVQLRAAGGRVLRPGPLLKPRRLAAALAGFVALMFLSGWIIDALVARDSTTPARFVGAMTLLGLTQLVGFVDPGRRLVTAVVLAVLAGIALVGGTVVVIGPEVWNQGWDIANLGPAMTRSVVVTVLITACQVVTSILAGYAFAYLRFPLRGLIFAFFVGTLLLPLEVTLLGNQEIVRDLQWLNSTQGLVLPFAATALGTFLIRQGFRGVPAELRDAARLDGYGHFGFLWRIAVPVTRPVIASFTLIAALGAWNQYLWPRAVIFDDTRETAQIALRGIAVDRPEEANIAVAAALLVAIPIVLLLVAFQRHIIRGLTAGAVKG